MPLPNQGLESIVAIRTFPLAKPGRARRLLNAEQRAAVVMLTPLLLVILLLLAYPLVYAITLSFQKKSLGLPGVFVGLDNYRMLITEDLVFPKLVRNTIVYTVACVAIKSVLGLGMALVLNEGIKARSFFRGLLMIPWVVPQAVVALNWRWILQQNGVLNYVLVGLGISETHLPWLARTNLAMISLIVVHVWAMAPFFGVNFLAAMQTIPGELYEAAEVDGASALQRFWHITLPGIRSTYLVLVILSTIWTWNAFTHIFLLTGGGPVNNTQIFATYAYSAGLAGHRMGYAAAVSLVSLPLLLLIVILLSPMLLRSREEA